MRLDSQSRLSRSRGFSLLELMLSLGAIGLLAVAVTQNNIKQAELDTADAFGINVALYNNGVAAYIADAGTGMPAGTFTGFDWLRSAGCGGSAPDDYVPCDWNPRLPFNMALETDVIHGTGAPGDPCPDPVGHVCAWTRITVPSANGQERLDLAAEALHASQGATVAVRSTQQDYRLSDAGELQVTVRGHQSPPWQYLTRDGSNNMQANFNMGDKDMTDVGNIQATGDVRGSRFIDEDDPAYIVDPDAASTLANLRTAGDLDATGGGNLTGNTRFPAGADIAAIAAFNADVDFLSKSTFTGGQTDFNADVLSTGPESAHFRVARIDDLADFNAELEIVGSGVIGGPCNAAQENLRFNSAGELLECVSAQWQYAGAGTPKGSITYYDLAAANGYGEFHWAGGGIGIPGKHSFCSTQSIESSSTALGGGALVESTSGPDSFGRRSFQYIAHGGVLDPDTIPIQLQSGERNVICLTLGPEPVQSPVSTVRNTAPSGSVSCTSGLNGVAFVASLSVSDPDTPLLYQWSASGACSLSGITETQALVRRNRAGTCSLSVQITDYYNASRTISSSCQVTDPQDPTVDGVCSCSTLQCVSGDVYDVTPSQPSGWDPRPPPLGDGPWDPDKEWYCDGRNGGGWDYCQEGSSCPSPVNGSCSTTVNRCNSGNAGSLTTLSQDDRTTFRWTCRGLAGGSSDSCERIYTHTPPCDPATDRVNGSCGTAFGTCNAGTPVLATNNAWLCRGQCTGSDDLCRGTPPSVVNGVCGATLNSCSAGTYQPVSGPTWNCMGQNGGVDATGCAVIVNGSCGTGIGTCAQGTPIGTTNPWTCQGSNGGVDTTCQFAECGAQANTCDTGTYVNITGSLSWRCLGNNTNSGADDVTCEAGVCGDTQGTCDSGTPSGSTNPWVCQGTHADPLVTADDVTCEVGACGVSDDAANGCTQGTWEDVTDPPPPATPVWNCLGSVPGSSNDDAACTTGFGVCGDTQGTCAQGTPVGAGTQWVCEGTDTLGSADDVDCEIGICDFSAVGQCIEGESTDDTGASNPWTCQGSVGTSTNDDDVCEDAVCGLADNPTEGCIVGTYRHVPGNVWDCVGQGHGTANDALNCMAPVASQCGTSPGDCVAGTPTPVIDSTWTCEGQHPDPNVTTDDIDCSLPVCEDVAGDCQVGTPVGATNPWACEGLNTGVSIPCSVGICNFAGLGLCTQGTPDSSDYRWRCEGGDILSSHDDIECEKAQCRAPGDGGEDNSLKGCDSGDWEAVDDPAPPNDVPTWNCRGNDELRTDDDDLGCTAPPVPIDGECKYVDPDTPGRCEQGTSVGEGNQWTCEGVNGGADDTCTVGQCAYEDDPNDPADGCLFGTYQAVTAGIEWHCLGGDIALTTDDHRHCEPPDWVLSECKYDSDNVGECNVGTPTGNTSPWTCEGTHPDPDFTSDDVECVIGVCGTSDNCDAGQYVDVPGDTWQCRGNHPTASITTDDVTCTPPDPEDCDFGGIYIDRSSTTPPASCVPAPCVPRPGGSWIVTNTAKPLHQCPDSTTCAVAGGVWRDLAGTDNDFCETTSPTHPMWAGWSIGHVTSEPHGLLELDWNNDQGEWTYYCANTCDATAQTCVRNGAAWNERCEHLHAAAMANNTGIPYWDQALSQTPACEGDDAGLASDPSNGAAGFCDGGLPGNTVPTDTGREWRCHGAGFPASSVDCGTCDSGKGYEGDWPNCTEIP